MLFLLFDNGYSFCDLIECFILTTVVAENRCFLKEAEFLTKVVVDVELLLDVLHFSEIGLQVGVLVVLKRFTKLSFVCFDF